MHCLSPPFYHVVATSAYCGARSRLAFYRHPNSQPTTDGPNETIQDLFSNYKPVVTPTATMQSSTMSRKMEQAYLEQSIAELESQLREVRMKKSRETVRCKACLLDISMLVYALPVVKKWARSNEYAELLLPVDGKSTAALCFFHSMPRNSAAKYKTFCNFTNEHYHHVRWLLQHSLCWIY